MKLCVSGKGGVGKTLTSAALAKALAASGRVVYALDADPDANLGLALGVDETDLAPLAEMRDLIRERTEAGSGGWGVMFRMNPQVGDIPERYYREADGVRLMVLGAVRSGGGGCACPENVFLRTLLNHMVLSRKEALVLDLEAGVEPLGRATVTGVDWLLVAAEPTPAAMATVARIKRLADDLKMKRTGCVATKVRGPEQLDYVRSRLPSGVDLVGSVPYIPALEREYRVTEELSASAEEILTRLGRTDRTRERPAGGNE